MINSRSEDLIRISSIGDFKATSNFNYPESGISNTVICDPEITYPLTMTRKSVLRLMKIWKHFPVSRKNKTATVIEF